MTVNLWEAILIILIFSENEPGTSEKCRQDTNKANTKAGDTN